MLRLARAVRVALCVIFFALVVLLVPSSAWSATTEQRPSSAWSSLSPGSSSVWALGQPTPPDPEPLDPETSPETLPDPEPSSPLPSPGPSPDSSPQPSEPPTFSAEQIEQLESLMVEQEAAMLEAATDCGYDTHPACETRIVTGQWDTINEGLVVAATALSVLVLVGLTRLVGGWGRRDR